MKKVIIVGAGPAGLTAALEILNKTDYIPVVIEATDEIGGISRTVKHNGNRMDIGGHRFFSKSDTVMNWWKEVLPVQGKPSKDDILIGRDLTLSDETRAPDPEKTDLAMLVRNRISRIFYTRKFFDYPVSLSVKTITNLGIVKMMKIGFSYLGVKINPRKQEHTLEDFFINRFGKELYLTFFKSYTEKVWGVPCNQISSEWGAQRIKGLSITKTVMHACKKLFAKKDASLEQKGTETSLIEQFLYPKLGPGQLWEHVAELIRERGGEVVMGETVTAIRMDEDKITSVETSTNKSYEGDYYYSTMPIKDLAVAMGDTVPAEVKEVALNLSYRDFITVGVLVDSLNVKNESGIKTVHDIIPDNWVYIQEPDVKLGRVQVFNNWSPYLVDDDSKVWMGLEYFANEGDELWSLSNDEMIALAKEELEKIGFIESGAVLDAVAIKVPKAYPAYFGSYDHFDTVKEYLNSVENLFCIGRNGMHRYNNQDHSMLAAMAAVEAMRGEKSKESVWMVNAEDEYHESK